MAGEGKRTVTLKDKPLSLTGRGLRVGFQEHCREAGVKIVQSVEGVGMPFLTVGGFVVERRLMSKKAFRRHQPNFFRLRGFVVERRLT